MSVYKNRSRDKGNINSDYIRATQSGSNIVNASKISASNLIPNLPIKTDNLNVLQSTKLSISDTIGLQTAIDNASGIQYNGTIPAPIGNFIKIIDVDGNVEESTLTETDILNLQNDKVNKSGDTITGNLDMTGNSLFNLRTITGNGIDSVQILNGGQGLDAFVERARIQSVNNIELSAGVNNVSCESNLDINNNNINNINNLQTLEIASNGGVSVNFQDDINMGQYEINNCNELRVSTISSAITPDVNVISTLDMNNNNIENVGNMNVSSINSITPVGGLYSGISNGNVINQASGQSDLLPISSVGSLLIPANSFQIGDAYHIVIAGIFPDETKNDEVEVQIKQNGTVLGSVTLQYEDLDTDESNFEIEADFIIRSIGITGSLATNIDFTFNKKVTKDFKGTRSTSITTIDTTTTSNLSVLATVTGTSSIQSTMAYLRKQY